MILNVVKKYFAVSSDNKKLIEFNHLDCLVIFEIYICRNLIVLSVFEHKGCIVDVFFNRVDSLCNYNVRILDTHILLSHNGSNLCGEIMTSISNYFNIKRITTSIAHPQSNGSCDVGDSKVQKYLGAPFFFLNLNSQPQ